MMKTNPYHDLSLSAFWKSGVHDADPYSLDSIYGQKFAIAQETKIATAGSCFAQHIHRKLKERGFNVLDYELPPPGLHGGHHHFYGYSMYSARYGNIYSVRHLLQLIQEAAGERSPIDAVWQKNGMFFDALRPAIEPEGLCSVEDVVAHRCHHLAKVIEVFVDLDLFIFTLGLTEMWVHQASGTVYPSAPGTVVGEYDASKYMFVNAEFTDIVSDFNLFLSLLRRLRNGRPFNVLLTVSPVPLTATASGKHVLVANSYSKSVLRAVAGHLAHHHPNVDYFPAYEIVTNPCLRSMSFASNLRSVTNQAVTNVMNHFFAIYPPVFPAALQFAPSNQLELDAAEAQCEDALMEAFQK
jgi:hypothetical protein